jgi:hypothetical protein
VDRLTTTMRTFIPLCLLGAACTLSTAARADRVFLVGGTVLEGKTTTKNGKVIVQTEAGEVAVPADSVSRIEKSESGTNGFEARYSALQSGDVQGRLDLADYCRSRDMRTRERKLLLEVIDLDKDNQKARARLGHVKTETGWMTEDEAMQAKGFVRQDGQWVSRSQLVEMERLRMEKEAQARAYETAEAERQAKRVQESIRQTELESQRNRLVVPYYPPIYGGYYRSYYPPAYGSYLPAFGVGSVAPGFAPGFVPSVQPVRPGPGTSAFDSDMSVVKVPYRRR